MFYVSKSKIINDIVKTLFHTKYIFNKIDSN